MNHGWNGCRRWCRSLWVILFRSFRRPKDSLPSFLVSCLPFSQGLGNRRGGGGGRTRGSCGWRLSFEDPHRSLNDRCWRGRNDRRRGRWPRDYELWHWRLSVPNPASQLIFPGEEGGRVGVGWRTRFPIFSEHLFLLLLRHRHPNRQGHVSVSISPERGSWRSTECCREPAGHPKSRLQTSRKKVRNEVTASYRYRCKVSTPRIRGIF